MSKTSSPLPLLPAFRFLAGALCVALIALGYGALDGRPGSASSHAPRLPFAAQDQAFLHVFHRTSAAAGSSSRMQERIITVHGVERRYLLQASPSGTTPQPLVVALHGLHGNPLWMAQTTGLAMQTKQTDVVLAAPFSMAGVWNDGRLGANGPDDTAFVLALVRSLVAEHLVDPNRVVITGFSNGAEMALTLACRHPEVFASVVSVAGELDSVSGSARPSAPIPAYFVHGTADVIQPYGGRPMRNRLLPGLISEQATVATFVAANHAGAQPVVRSLTSSHGKSCGVVRDTWQTKTAMPVVLYRIAAGGHAWPSIATTAVGRGIESSCLDASQLVVQVATSSALRTRQLT